MNENENLYSLSMFTGKVASEIGKSVSAAWISKYMKEIDPPEGDRYTTKKRFTQDQVNLFVLFAKEVHQRKGEHSFLEWIKDHNFSIPQRHIEKRKEVVKRKTKKSKGNNNYNEKIAELETRLKEIDGDNKNLAKQVRSLINAINEKVAIEDKTGKREEITIKDLDERIEELSNLYKISPRKIWWKCKKVYETKTGGKVPVNDGYDFRKYVMDHHLIENMFIGMDAYHAAIEAELNGDDDSRILSLWG